MSYRHILSGRDDTVVLLGVYRPLTMEQVVAIPDENPAIAASMVLFAEVENTIALKSASVPICPVCAHLGFASYRPG